MAAALRSRPCRRTLAVLALAGALCAAPGARAGPPRFDLANRCYALLPASAGGPVIVAGPGAYGVAAGPDVRVARLYLKPTGLGTYLLSDAGGLLLTVGDGGGTTRAPLPAPPAEWRASLARRGFTSLTSTANGRVLAARGPDLVTVPAGSAGRAGRFSFIRTRGCRPYPEAQVGATGRPFRGRRRDGTVLGFADAHLHLVADLRAGGRVLYGEAFDRFGVTEALGHDADVHGPNGVLDVTGNLLRSGIPVGTHDTHGWPTFTGWPTNDTYTHQQTYYMWLKRAWMAGLRLVTAQLVEDEPLCRLEPLRSHSCDETATIELQVRRLRALRDYIDAQSGGPGRGWLRLVYGPREARRAIERGKLALLMGVESSNPFGCSEVGGRPRCGRAQVDRGIRLYRRLGIRGMFIAHWVDNAFAGAALEGGAKGAFIGVLELLQTGGFFRTGPCPEAGEGEEVVPALPAGLAPLLGPLLGKGAPVYPPGPQCNARGLTDLGAYLVRRLMDNHMLIEMDHLSEVARLQVLRIAEARRYPLVSSHTGTGGFWTPSDLRRLYALGGFATARPDEAAALAARIVELRRYGSRRHYFGVGLGTDTGGFNALPAADHSPHRAPLPYPFRSADRRVVFLCETTGSRTFDVNKDGVAHYGLFADLLADMRRQKDGRAATHLLFRSAEAYLRMWQLALRL